MCTYNNNCSLLNFSKDEIHKEVLEKQLCPYCNSLDLIKRGIRRNCLFPKQRYYCKECKKRFVLEPVKKVKGNAKLICLTMDLFYKGNSFRDISDTLQQFFNIKISHETIRNWTRRFSVLMNEHTKTLQPATGLVWNADETVICTKDIKNQNHYLWNVLDKETKFLLASETYGRSRGIKEVKKVMQKAWDQNKKMPVKIITDRLPAYQEGIRKTFKNWGEQQKVKHCSIVGRRRWINNNPAENLHSQMKEFQKVRRGVKEIQDYADGFRVFHNFIRQGINDSKTPAERCNLQTCNLPNRWIPLLERSLKSD